MGALDEVVACFDEVDARVAAEPAVEGRDWAAPAEALLCWEGDRRRRAEVSDDEGRAAGLRVPRCAAQAGGGDHRRARRPRNGIFARSKGLIALFHWF